MSDLKYLETFLRLLFISISKYVNRSLYRKSSKKKYLVSQNGCTTGLEKEYYLTLPV